jgi:hypothetical protein
VFHPRQDVLGKGWALFATRRGSIISSGFSISLPLS